MSGARRRFFRGLRVLGECGCEVVHPTSFYRIDPRTYGVMVGNLVRSGVFCPTHQAKCQPVEFKGTARLR